ncbi:MULTISPECIES: putative Ig domain-containing protein [Ensifer]|uniref:putative Ig domain-containing protein n=1 Tax=Ensifer TaxID=106591 RepID=UPI0015EC09EE|nr:MULTISPECIES: putative Ig domain-containing protein [Ensifer]MCY1745814.1 putative Ig domain-containing protein [Ensifer sp. SL37]
MSASTDTLSGTPTAIGPSNFTITATDAYGASIDTAYSLSVVYPAITVSPAAGVLPGGTTGTAYSQTISASGGSAPYRAIVAGSFPGLTLDPTTGVLSGTLTVAGPAAFTIAVTDAHGAMSQASYSMMVAFPSITMAPAPGALPGLTGTTFNRTISVSGGSAPYSYVVSGGSLPNGITFDGGTGTLSGTPTTAASCAFTITATDGYRATAAGSYTVEVSTPILVLSPSAVTLPVGTATGAYSQQIFCVERNVAL